MLETLKAKEIERCNKIIASYNEDIEVINAQIDGITEKYMEMARKEAEELNKVLDYYTIQKDEWVSKLSGLIEPSGSDEPIKETPKEESVSEPVKEEEEEKVVDLFAQEESAEETSEPEQTEEPENEESEPEEASGEGVKEEDLNSVFDEPDNKSNDLVDDDWQEPQEW